MNWKRIVTSIAAIGTAVLGWQYGPVAREGAEIVLTEIARLIGW